MVCLPYVPEGLQSVNIHRFGEIFAKREFLPGYMDGQKHLPIMTGNPWIPPPSKDLFFPPHSCIEYVVNPKLSRLAGILSLTAIYFAAGKLGLLMANLHSSVSPIWPASGIAVAALLLWGYRLWP